jgi:hypothetical protein
VRRLLVCLPLCCLLAPSLPDPPRPERSANQYTPEDADFDLSPLPSAEVMRRLARTEPVVFLQHCMRYYHRQVRCYTLTLQKRERISGQLHPREVIEVFFQEKPYSVLLRWREGARLAERALYVEGDHDGQMLVRPAGGLLRTLVGAIVPRDPHSVEARQSGRLPITEYGVKHGLKRTLRAWTAAQQSRQLQVDFEGEQTVPQTGDRTCLVLHRTRYAHPEGDGIADQVVYVDTETWLPLGTVVRDVNGQLIGEYFVRDLRLNPKFPPGQFTPAALNP